MQPSAAEPKCMSQNKNFNAIRPKSLTYGQTAPKSLLYVKKSQFLSFAIFNLLCQDKNRMFSKSPA